MTKFSIPIWLFTGLAALAMASVAAFFSITGLAALYAAAAVPVIVMGTCIEFSKIVSTVWLHHFWKKSNFLMVGTLVLMVIASMAVTSGGVYGYLTGSHASQEAPGQQKQLTIDRYEQQIKVEQDKAARYQDRLKSLDNIVSTSLGQGTRGGVSADRINRRQNTERKQIQDELDATYKRVDDLSAQKLTVNQEQAESEAKLGAVKYLAALFGADPSNAVMYFTLIMVLLLDPFAIILVIATQVAYGNRKKEINEVEWKPELTPERQAKVEELKQRFEPKSRQLIVPEIPEEIVEKIEKNEELPDLFESLKDKPEFIPEELADEPVEEWIEPSIPEPADERMTEFFNDQYVKDSISSAEDETIIKIDEVVNAQDITDDEKVEQVIQALGSTLSPDQMKEVKKRWLE